METILHQYRQLLDAVDAWFLRCRQHLGGEGGCRSECAECCRGLFDITLLDACLLRQGFEQLPPATRGQVLSRSRPILQRLQRRFPGIDQGWLLPADAADCLPLVDEEETPCPLLDAAGRCLLYAHRPLTCRLYGLPHVDVSGETFLDEWCPHRGAGRDLLAMPGLRWEFKRVFAEEGRLLRVIADRLQRPLAEDLDTFIPVALQIDLARLKGL